MSAEETQSGPAVLDRKIVHDGWSTFVIARIRLPNGAVVNREIEDHGRAVCVLPYDPARKVAILIRQFRPPAFVAGGEASLVEAPAGLLDEDDPQDCARREAMEECGLRLTTLEPVVRGWTMPGISTERMDFFLAPYGEQDRIGDGGGLAEEHEDITVLELPLAELAAQAARGELTDVKTLMLVLTLQVRRPYLFA
jgi:nudix-type nucleoside diphosphatase (YffH/AdpP family)